MPGPLKDNIGPEEVARLATVFERLVPGFDSGRFEAELGSVLPPLALKARVDAVADQLASHLPDDYHTALAAVLSVADEIDGWAAWPLCTFVERHGVEHAEVSLDAMPALTRRWTCEFAVRPFLDRHLDRTRRHLRRWVLDPDPAVRRLASEGTRPLLPWAPRVPALLDDPRIGLELLDHLARDSSEDVRRSVANHLNDVAKAHPEMVVSRLRGWLAGPQPLDPGLVRHALRTLVKEGYRPALELAGFTTEPRVDVVAFECVPERVELGGTIELVATLRSGGEDEQRLVVDFVIHHVTADGSTSPKVFKWTTVTLAPGQIVDITKRRRIRTASTRRYTAGRHEVDLQISGVTSASTWFELGESSPPR